MRVTKEKSVPLESISVTEVLSLLEELVDDQMVYPVDSSMLQDIYLSLPQGTWDHIYTRASTSKQVIDWLHAAQRELPGKYDLASVASLRRLHGYSSSLVDTLRNLGLLEMIQLQERRREKEERVPKRRSRCKERRHYDYYI